MCFLGFDRLLPARQRVSARHLKNVVLVRIAIAFMCLTLARALSYRVKVQQRTAMSEARIRTALHKTEVAIASSKRDKKRYAIPMPLTTDARKLYKVMNLPYRNEPFAID